MSFHGGLIGVLLVESSLHGEEINPSGRSLTSSLLPLPRTGVRENRKLHQRRALRKSDTGSLGNDFSRGGPLPRHPSQLYECGLEGIVLFVILWVVKDRKLPTGGLLALFLMLYGMFRFFVEFFREPDSQLGFVLGSFTMGQILCALMIGVGAVLMVTLSRRG